MVGALTVMIVILAVFLAYNANNGLPFVPSYRISVDLPDANQLVPRQRGPDRWRARRAIEAIEPIQDEDGNVKARLDLKLDPDVDPLPDRLDGDRPGALGARPQVPGDRPRDLVGGLRRRARSCRSRPRHRSRSRSTRC